ncbi:hypothetical protein HT031_003686 [Scenedesmus sp. PABB004]|nr:hypothetical protein HT031_003686 [Scenedesmus sp. PABB004]
MSSKSPLDAFYKDALRIGNLKCFNHFSLYLKGREELVVTVYHGPLPASGSQPIARLSLPGCARAAARRRGGAARSAARAAPTPAPRRPARSAGPEQALPPASPASHESDVNNPEVRRPPLGAAEGARRVAAGAVDPRSALAGDRRPQVTVFLIGAYAKYNWPYVWLRSLSRNHQGVDIDAPLDIPSTKNWKAQGLRAWDIVAELIALNIAPPPVNPFAAGATASFLRELLLSPGCAAPAAVEADLQRCLDMHFRDMPQLIPEAPGALPPECLERLQPAARGVAS